MRRGRGETLETVLLLIEGFLFFETSFLEYISQRHDKRKTAWVEGNV